MSSSKSILWLASWYPNKFGPYDGDFIQRHALAVSAKVPIQVLFVKKGLPSQMRKGIEVQTFERKGLRETIGYYKPMETGIDFLDRITSFLQYLLLYRKLITDFIRQKGQPELVHGHVTMRAGLMALWLKKKYSIPYIITEHWTGFSTRPDDNFYQQNWLLQAVTKLVLRQSATILPVCRYLGDQMKMIAPGVPFQVINNVVDTGLFYPGETSQEGLRFFHASSLNRQKNPEAILRAFASIKISGWELVIAGPATSRLKRLGQELGIENKITWLGEISYPAVADEMRKSNLLVMFSRFENLPCVIAEALCSGLTVISSRVGGVPEMLDESNGLFVDTELQLVDGIEQLAAKNFDKRKIAGLASSRYNYEKIAADFALIYDSFQK